MPQPILEPLVFMSGNNGVSGLGSVKKKPEIWHIQVDQNTFHEPRAQHRENPSKVSQLENTIQFMNKQHNDVLRSLQAEIEALKQRNRGTFEIWRDQLFSDFSVSSFSFMTLTCFCTILFCYKSFSEGHGFYMLRELRDGVMYQIYQLISTFSLLNILFQIFNSVP